MRGVINQPCLFPEVHVIHRLWWVGQDMGFFVLMNKAQFQRKYGMAAARFPNSTVGMSLAPVEGRAPCKDRFLASNLETWRYDMNKAVFRKYPSQAMSKLAIIFDICKEGRNYADTCMELTVLIKELAGIHCLIIPDDECDPPVEHDPCGWILSMCKRLHITDYFCGAKISKEYLDLERCKAENVNIIFQDWLPPADGNVTWLHYWFADKMDELKGAMK